MNRAWLAYAAALVLDLVGAGGALLVSARTWQTVTTPRPAPLPSDVLDLSGRTVDAAPTALAVVALAGVVAVVATRGPARRVVGVVLALAGAGIVWRAAAAAGAIGTPRARSLVTDRHRTVDAGGVVPSVATHGAWPALTVVCGVLVAAAGVLVAARGHRWRALGARYERPAGAGGPGDEAADRDRPGADTRSAAPALWTALDRGDDPTDDPPDSPTDDPTEDSSDDPTDQPADDPSAPR